MRKRVHNAKNRADMSSYNNNNNNNNNNSSHSIFTAHLQSMQLLPLFLVVVVFFSSVLLVHAQKKSFFSSLFSSSGSHPDDGDDENENGQANKYSSGEGDNNGGGGIRWRDVCVFRSSKTPTATGGRKGQQRRQGRRRRRHEQGRKNKSTQTKQSSGSSNDSNKNRRNNSPTTLNDDTYRHDTTVTTDSNDSTKSKFRPRQHQDQNNDDDDDDEYKWDDDAVDTMTTSPVMTNETDILLHPSSGFVGNGKLCGIIGPSGAGKTTLLSVLGGTTPRNSGLRISGSVWFEEEEEEMTEVSVASNDNATGKLVKKSYLSTRNGEVAMLQQHDVFFSMLTPRETVDLAAFLQLDINESRRRRAVDRTLDSLGLTAVENQRIGERSTGGGGCGLSGGERRRLSVALELITQPKIFLADEPTTGLDSSQAGKVINLMVKLARERNIPVVCSLHQPRASIWKSLDSFILMAPGGKICYMGDRRQAVSHFANLGYRCPPETNPAEFFIDLVSIDTEDPEQALVDEKRIDCLFKAFSRTRKSSIDAGSATWQPPSKTDLSMHNKGVNRARSRKLNFLQRWGVLFLRSLRQNTRNSKVNLLRLGASTVQAVLFSQIFKTVREGKSIPKSIADRTALLSFGVINMCMMAFMKTLDLFGREKPVVRREQMRNQYYSVEYLLAKALAEIPLDTCFAAVFAFVLKSTTGLRIPLSMLAGTFSLMTVAGASMGFAIGSMTPNVETAMSTGVPIMVILMTVSVINPSGVDVNDAPPKFIAWLKLASPIKWAIEALCVAEYQGMEFGKDGRGWRIKDLPRMGGLALVKNGDQVLEALGLSGLSYEDLMKNLAFLSGAYLLVSWLGLHFGGADFVEATGNGLLPVENGREEGEMISSNEKSKGDIRGIINTSTKGKTSDMRRKVPVVSKI